MPQYPIEQPGSASVTAVNPFSASGYQKECKVHTACLKLCCTAGLQEDAKSTSSMIFAPVSARALDCIGNASSTAAAKPIEIRPCVMAMPSPKQLLVRADGNEPELADV